MKELLPNSPVVKESSHDVVTSDPASFMLAASVINRVRESITELKSWLKTKPELEQVLDNTLSRLVRAGIVRVIGDRILVLNARPHFKMNERDKMDALHKVILTVAQRVQKEITDKTDTEADDVAWICLPDDPKVRRRIFEISSRFVREMRALQEEVSSDPEFRADKVRFTMIMSGKLEPEDL